MDNKENNYLNKNNKEELNNNKEELIVIKCSKCNNILPNFKEIENIICPSCGNIINNLQQVNIKKIEKEVIVNKEEKLNIKEQKHLNDKELIIDVNKKKDFFYLANIIIGQNFVEILFINFIFILNVINLLFLLVSGGYLIFWIYKYITLNAYLNQIVIFLIIFLILGIILYGFSVFYNSIFYKLAEKLLLIFYKNKVNKSELKLVNKSLLNFENLKKFFYTGFRVFLLSSKANLKYFILYILMFVLLYLFLEYIIKKAIYNGDFLFVFFGILLVFNLFFLIILFALAYNNLIKQLVILFDVKNRFFNNKEISDKDLFILINNFLGKNKKRILIFILFFLVIYYFLIPVIQFLFILTGIGFLFIYLPLILLEIYFTSFLGVYIFLEDMN